MDRYGDEGWIAIDSNPESPSGHTHRQYFNDGSSHVGVYDRNTQRFSGVVMAAVAADGTTLPGYPNTVTVRTSDSVVNLWDGGEWRAPTFWFIDAAGMRVGQYPNLPANTVFQVNGSPFYLYHGSGQLTLDGTGEGGWPGSNFMSTPPQRIYLNGQAFDGPGLSYIGAGIGWFADQLAYTHANNSSPVTITRYFVNGTYSGSISGSALGMGFSAFSGTFDPETWQVVTNPAWVAISFSPPNGYPLAGHPALISLNGTLLQAAFSDLTGRDFYADASDTLHVAIASDNSVGFQLGGGGLEPCGTFHNGQFDSHELLALTTNGELLGTPPGLVVYFGQGQSAPSVLDGQGNVLTPTYSFARPDGTTGVKYLGLTFGTPILLARDGSYVSPLYLYQPGVGDLVINATSDWPPTNYPAQITVNGLPCPLDHLWPEDGTGRYRSGGASYRSSSGDPWVELSWTWNHTFAGWGVQASLQDHPYAAGFATLPEAIDILAANHSRFGVERIEWNNRTFDFDAAASWEAGGDVYRSSSGFRFIIYHDGTVVISQPGGAQFLTGTYDGGTGHFDFGTHNAGTIRTYDGADHLLATSSSDGSGSTLELPGSLDVHGNAFTLGSWWNEGGTLINGLALSFLDGGNASDIRFQTTRRSTQWVWMHPEADGHVAATMSMSLDRDHRLRLFPPGGGSAPKIILDPSGRSRFDGPVRIAPQGDISMGEFTHEPAVP
jgi:hypothetical protein